MGDISSPNIFCSTEDNSFQCRNRVYSKKEAGVPKFFRCAIFGGYNLAFVLLVFNEFMMKAGDLIRIFDPDHDKIDGYPFTTSGLLLQLSYKTSHPSSWRIFKVMTFEGEVLTFDEPYWEAELLEI